MLIMLLVNHKKFKRTDKSERGDFDLKIENLGHRRKSLKKRELQALLYNNKKYKQALQQLEENGKMTRTAIFIRLKKGKLQKAVR